MTIEEVRALKQLAERCISDEAGKGNTERWPIERFRSAATPEIVIALCKSYLEAKG